MKANCSDALKHLVEYLEGDLSEDEEDALESHFEHCDPCLRFLETYRSTGPICKKALEKEMPEQMKDSLLQFLRENASPDA